MGSLQNVWYSGHTLPQAFVIVPFRYLIFTATAASVFVCHWKQKQDTVTNCVFPEFPFDL